MAGRKIGSGQAFAGLEHKLSTQRGVKNPAALAAAIGRKKYGDERFKKLAQAGQRRAAREREAAPATPPPRRRVMV